MANTWRRFFPLARSASIPIEFQSEFEAFQHQKFDKITAPVIKLGTSILVALLAIDYFIIPDVLAFSVVMRCAVAIPIAACALAWLRQPGHSVMRHHIVSASVPILFGLLACWIVSSSSAPLAPMYMTANNITIMFAILMLALPTAVATAVAFTLILGQGLLVATSWFSSPSVIFLMTGSSVAVALPSLYANARMRRDLERQFLAKQRDAEQLRKLAAQNVLLERLSALDPLTCLSNRRGFDEVLRTAIADARTDRSVKAVALAMIDIDHFKLFNDALGHPAGDAAIRSVALALSEATGDNELVARYGGEEFAVVMPQTNPLALEIVGARLRTSVEKLRIPHPASPTGKTLSVSIGIAYADREVITQLTPAELIEAADRALYKAKSDGRNRAVIAAWICPLDPEPHSRLPHLRLAYS